MDLLAKPALTESSKQLTRLLRFLSSKDPFILISGSQDCGKTRLLSQIDHYFRSSRHVIHIDTQSNLKPEEFLKLITTKCNLPPTDPTLTNSFNLNQVITSLNQQHCNYLLIIDDAHLLPFDTLAAIQHLSLQLESESESESIKLQLLLAGESDLSAKMHGFFRGVKPEINLTRKTYKQLIDAVPKTPPSWIKIPRQRIKTRILSICGIITVGLCFVTLARHYEHQTNFYFIPSDPSNITIIH